MTNKEKIRTTLQHDPRCSGLPPHLWGKVAEKTRGLDVYRQADTVFVTPTAPLTQIRINSLLDGKNLIMPASGLKDGFFIIKPQTVPFKNLDFAVTPKGLIKYGKRLTNKAVGNLSPDIMLTEAVAVDLHGARLGDGRGFFDLSCALLNELGAVDADTPVFAVTTTEQIIADRLPVDPWDIMITGIITPAGIHRFAAGRRPTAKLFWHALTLKQIKKATPLWEIYRQRQLAGQTDKNEA